MDAAKGGWLGGLVNGAALCRDLFCFLAKWKNAWWLQAEKNNVIGYGQFSATLENGGFISVTTAELLFGSGRSCAAHSLSSHVGTEPGEHSVTGAISRSMHIESCLAKHFGGRKRTPNTSGQACRAITRCLCFSLASLGHGSQL